MSPSCEHENQKGTYVVLCCALMAAFDFTNKAPTETGNVQQPQAEGSHSASPKKHFIAFTALPHCDELRP